MKTVKFGAFNHNNSIVKDQDPCQYAPSVVRADSEMMISVALNRLYFFHVKLVSNCYFVKKASAGHSKSGYPITLPFTDVLPHRLINIMG